MADRFPYSAKYCKAVNCHLRRGTKCTVAECQRLGCLKRTYYFLEHGHLADGDIPEGA